WHDPPRGGGRWGPADCLLRRRPLPHGAARAAPLLDLRALRRRRPLGRRAPRPPLAHLACGEVPPPRSARRATPVRARPLVRDGAAEVQVDDLRIVEEIGACALEAVLP